MNRRAYWLVGIEGRAVGMRTPITGPILIGRGTYNHLVLNDSRISRQHARVTLEADGCCVYDLSSTHGTFVNGVRVNGRAPLRLNDEISFDAMTFRVTSGSQEFGGEEEFSPVETPTRRDLASVRSMVAVTPVSGVALPSSHQLPSSQQLPDLRQLEDAHEKLGMLYTFIQTIGQTIERDALLERICSEIREVYHTARCVAIYLTKRTGAGHVFELAYFLGSTPTDLPEDITSRILSRGKAFLMQPLPGRKSGGTRIYVPLVHQSEILGVIHAIGDPLSFSPADIDLLSGMAAPAAMMLSIARHHEELVVRNRHSYDLELASQIQKSFLPREVIAVEGFELFAEYKAAFSVGGDFYDVFWVAPNRLGVFVGDIAGKGVSGALLMARISSEMRSAAVTLIEPVEVLAAMNEALLARDQPELFFTAIYLTVNVRTGDIVLANAGHPNAYLVDASGVVKEVVDGAAGPIGIVEEAKFESTRMHLEDGDSLVIYTDGVIEATAADGSMYGSHRLENAIAGPRKRPRPIEITEGLLESVKTHVADQSLTDDLTLFVLERNVDLPPSLQPRRRSTRMNQVRI